MKEKIYNLILVIITLAAIFIIFNYDKPVEINKNLIINVPRAHASAPAPIQYETVSETIREVTAYNVGDPLQCDSSPCISANGENICDAISRGYKRCAFNGAPFGTRLHIQGFGECLVTDRMNSRYKNRVDIAMPLDKKAEAIAFGLKRLKVKILK